MVLLVAALVILGPERLPGAIRWTFATLRKVRDYAGGATQQLRSDLGPEFDELRKPIADLQTMRGMTPRAVITKHLFDGDDGVLRSFESPIARGNGDFSGRSAIGDPIDAGTSSLGYDLNAVQEPLRAGERPPIDTDAT